MESRLAHEIGQSKPLSDEQVASATLQRTAAVLLQETMPLLAAAGVSPTQFNVLRILKGAGREGLRVGEVAARLVSPDPDATRLVDRMVRNGWAQRRRQEDGDRRVVRIRITRAGAALLRHLLPRVKQIQQRQFAGLGRERLHALVETLDMLRKEKT